MTRVFVYGTLKRGGENHEWIKSQTFVASARTKPLYRMFDLGGYPGMIRSENGLSIEGEVWDVDEAGLARLDGAVGRPRDGDGAAPPPGCDTDADKRHYRVLM